MKKIITDEKYGEIVYQESFWTGKKDISINGKKLVKSSKNVFEMEDGLKVNLVGNFLSGVKIIIGEEQIDVVPKVKWYEVVLSVLPFVLILVWGNSIALCKILPVVGGMIGGAISGGLSVGNLIIIKNIKQVWLKVIITIAMLGATLLSCYLIALAILA